jgi:hypothetical protein
MMQVLNLLPPCLQRPDPASSADRPHLPVIIIDTVKDPSDAGAAQCILDAIRAALDAHIATPEVGGTHQPHSPLHRCLGGCSNYSTVASTALPPGHPIHGCQLK